MANCKGLKGKALKDCLMANAVKRKSKKDSLVVERTRKRDSITKSRHEKRIKSGKPSRSTSLVKPKKKKGK
tara:strand:- start:21 stop:233 length:213 start_codon:yes stop_codon:yes gene_type:complete